MRYHLQGDQRLGICNHLADIDGYSIWHYRRAAEKDSAIVKEY
jgi:hypothetical protein